MSYLSQVFKRVVLTSQRELVLIALTKDGNFVVLGSGKLVEVQMSAEGSTFSRNQMNELVDLAEIGIAQLVTEQKSATS